MRFIQHDLGHRQRGEIVEVSLNGNAANVQLLDSSNFSAYRSGRRYRGYGGLARRSPVNLQIPNSGHWYVVVDLRGLRGNVKSNARILPSPLPEIRQTSLSSVPSLQLDQPNDEIEQNRSNQREYDVFISHASDDKDEVVRPLADALLNLGMRVWYDDFELKIGDSLRRKIDEGVSKSRFGIVIMSKKFFQKGWTNYELDGIVTRSVSGEQILLPIWHNVTKQEVMNYSASLADKVARSTATSTVDEIAEEIADLIQSQFSNH